MAQSRALDARVRLLNVCGVLSLGIGALCPSFVLFFNGFDGTDLHHHPGVRAGALTVLFGLTLLATSWVARHRQERWLRRVLSGDDPKHIVVPRGRIQTDSASIPPLRIVDGQRWNSVIVRVEEAGEGAYRHTVQHEPVARVQLR